MPKNWLLWFYIILVLRPLIYTSWLHHVMNIKGFVVCYIILLLWYYFLFRRNGENKRTEKEKKRIYQLQKQKNVNKLKQYFWPTFNYSARSRYWPDHWDILRLMDIWILKKCNRIGKKEDTFTYSIQQNWKKIVVKGWEIQTINSVYTTSQKGRGIQNLLVWQNDYSENYTNYPVQHCYIINVEYDQSRIEKHGTIVLKSRYSDSYQSNIWDFFNLINNPVYYSIEQGTTYRKKYKKEQQLSTASFFQQEFTKLFTVKSNDQVFARYIVNPAFMESITNFAVKIGKPLDFYLENGEIYIVLHLEDNEKFLEPEYTDEETLEQKLYQELQNIINVVKELNLLYWAKINTKDTAEKTS